MSSLEERIAKLQEIQSSDLTVEGKILAIKNFINDEEKAKMQVKLDAQAKSDASVKKVEILGAEVLAIKGNQGEKGDKGEQGEKGEIGETGLQGIQGKKGEKGDKGEAGFDGKDGIDGKNGLQGPQGEKGIDGKNGSSDSVLELRDKLHSLIGVERLDISAIKGISKLREEISHHTTTQARSLLAAGLLETQAGGIKASGTPSGLDTQVQFNDGGSFGGDIDFIWNKVTKNLILGQGLLTLKSGTGNQFIRSDETLNISAGEIASLGYGINISAGDAGGAILIRSGSAAADGDGGLVTILAREGGTNSGAGGSILLTAGNALLGDSNGGNIIFTAGVKTGAGIIGTYKFYSPIGGVYGILDFDSLASTDKTFTLPNESGTFVLNAFKTISVSGQSDIVADSATDVLTFVAGTNITITTSASGDSITINASGGGGSPGGSDTQVQFNDATAFGGSSAFTFTKPSGSTTGALSLVGIALASTGAGSGVQASTILTLTGAAGQATSLAAGNSKGGGGAQVFISAGDGGDNADAVNTTNSFNHRGGNGGLMTITTGKGGNATGATGSTGARGGAGGTLHFVGGDGGSTVNAAPGGAGAFIIFDGGAGGASGGADVSGQGGGVAFNGGNGGDNFFAGGTSGDGADCSMDGGVAGGVANGATPGVNGKIQIGPSSARAVEIGRSGITTTIFGNSDIRAVTKFANISTAGLGIPAIYGYGRSNAQTAAVGSVTTYTVGAADGSFEVSANVNVTTATTHNFTVTCTYTDETNTSRTLTLGFTQLAGATFLSAITNLTGIGPYESPTYHIRCKASTAITIATTGTFTTVTYNVEGIIKQTA